MSTTTDCPTWDLETYFDEFDSAQYQAFEAQLDTDLAALRDSAGAIGPLTGDTVDAWRKVFAETEDLMQRVSHLGSYLGCLGSADVRNEPVQAKRAALSVMSAEYQKLFVHIAAALKAADDAAFEQLVSHPDLATASYYIGRLREEARLTMDADLEALAADLGVTGFGAWGRLYSQISGELEFEMPDESGGTKQVPMSVKNSLVSDADPAVRKAALTNSNAAWAGMERVVGAALNAISGTRLTLYERRGIDHFLEPALFSSGITRLTLETMLGVMSEHRDLPRRYLRRKAALLGTERLEFQDLSAPLPLDDPEVVDWAEAVRRVQTAFDTVYPALGEYARMAFDKRWIDAEPRSGKAPGGFCTSSLLTRESRIFMTYKNTLRNVQTLAHELGHAFHNHVMRDLRPFARRYPMTLAETASTFAETVLTDAILSDPASSPKLRATILDTRLEGAVAFLLNIPMRYQFEYALYTERATGELPVSRIKELMLEAQRDCYGDVLSEDGMDPYFWASKLHFYITGVSFYNFPYSFGYLFSMGIYARAKAEGPAFLERFEELLSLTGSDTAENVARRVLGVDLEAPEFWRDSIALIEADVNAFDALAGELFS